MEYIKEYIRNWFAMASMFNCLWILSTLSDSALFRKQSFLLCDKMCCNHNVGIYYVTRIYSVHVSTLAMEYITIWVCKVTC